MIKFSLIIVVFVVSFGKLRFPCTGVSSVILLGRFDSLLFSRFHLFWFDYHPKSDVILRLRIFESLHRTRRVLYDAQRWKCLAKLFTPLSKTKAVHKRAPRYLHRLAARRLPSRAPAPFRTRHSSTSSPIGAIDTWCSSPQVEAWPSRT